jgi:hypothetical protein
MASSVLFVQALRDDHHSSLRIIQSSYYEESSTKFLPIANRWFRTAIALTTCILYGLVGCTMDLEHRNLLCRCASIVRAVDIGVECSRVRRKCLEQCATQWVACYCTDETASIRHPTLVRATCEIGATTLPGTEDFLLINTKQSFDVADDVLHKLDVLCYRTSIMIRWSGPASTNSIRIDHDLVATVPFLAHFGVKLKECADTAGAMEANNDGIGLVGIVGRGQVVGVAAVLAATFQTSVLRDTR